MTKPTLEELSKLNCTLAEWEGWIYAAEDPSGKWPDPVTDDGEKVWWKPSGESEHPYWPYSFPPSYTDDLNEMHRLEMGLGDQGQRDYGATLMGKIKTYCGHVSPFLFATAPAWVRALAYAEVIKQ